MHKIACVFSFKESSWVSCQKIVFNLHKAYEGVPGLELKNYDYAHDSWGSSVLTLVDELTAASPDTIIIMDHKPHPIFFLKFLLPRLEAKKPRIIFHVFGDFTLYYKDWNQLSTLLKDFEVEFIVASDRQKNLIDKFLVPPQVSHICPFPVRPEEFAYRPEERKSQRKSWA